jgi:hypothetical protein
MPEKTFNQWRTLAHELGHTLGLRHGGKNNQENIDGSLYRSLMNYAHQITETSNVRSFSDSTDPTFNDWGYVKLDFQNSLAMLGNSYQFDLDNYEVAADELIRPIPQTYAGPVITEVLVNSGSDQRSQVTRIDVTFSQSTNFASLISSGQVFDAVKLRALSAHPGDINLSGTTRFVWSPADNRLQIDLTTDGVGGATTPLLVDDNFELRFQTSLITSISTGFALEDTDDTVDGVYRFGFFQLAGDYNLDRSVNNSDYTAWRSAFGATDDSAADGNANGVVDAADFVLWRKNLGATLPVPAAAAYLDSVVSQRSQNIGRSTVTNTTATNVTTAAVDANFFRIGRSTNPIMQPISITETARVLSSGSDEHLLLALTDKSTNSASREATEAAFVKSSQRHQDDVVELEDWDDLAVSRGLKFPLFPD